jgi:hypothetical protein
MKARTLLSAISAAGVAILVACAAPDLTAPPPSEAAAQKQLLFGGSSSPSLLECPTNTAVSTSALVTTLGGTVSVGGVSIAIPAGALLQDANVTVTIPASQYVEADISVEGSEHFIFQAPVVVTLSYARCARSNIDLRPLSAWHIDNDTKALLEEMPSLDNKLLRTVTFTTGHLSGYAVAN